VLAIWTLRDSYKNKLSEFKKKINLLRKIYGSIDHVKNAINNGRMENIEN